MFSDRPLAGYEWSMAALSLHGCALSTLSSPWRLGAGAPRCCTALARQRHSALRRSYSIVLSGLGQTEQAPQPTRGIRRDAIVVVSNLCAYKRIDEVLAAFAEEPGLRDSYELIIAGMELEPGLRRRLKDLASALGCAERVRFTGFLTGAELLDL